MNDNPHEADWEKLQREIAYLTRSLSPELAWERRLRVVFLVAALPAWWFGADLLAGAAGALGAFGWAAGAPWTRAMRWYFRQRRHRLDRLNARATADKPSADWRARKAARERAHVSDIARNR